MQQFNVRADEVTDMVATTMDKVMNQFHELNPAVTDNTDKGAAMIAFKIGVDYFRSARTTLRSGSIISGGSLVRSALENLCDLYFIYDKPNPRADKYVYSMEDFRNKMRNISSTSGSTLAAGRSLKEVNKWTSSSITDRVIATGPLMVNIYDLLSYFSHPNPGALVYVLNKELYRLELNLMKQSNCIVAITLMALLLNHSDIDVVSHADLNNLSTILGMDILPKQN